ncbi:hypothetical protein FM120_07915 [Sphingobacterium faecium PCAi_F2.5]|nr:hypothetical protein FM120_07915 [Sphingobacterium faecium PCAi_F2.5]
MITVDIEASFIIHETGFFLIYGDRKEMLLKPIAFGRI